MTPPVDRRGNGRELTEDEVQAKIGERHERAKRAKNQTKGGIVLGAVGTAIAAYSGLVTGYIWMTVLGFGVALVGFGFVNVREVGDIARGLLGRGGKD